MPPLTRIFSIGAPTRRSFFSQLVARRSQPWPPGIGEVVRQSRAGGSRSLASPAKGISRYSACGPVLGRDFLASDHQVGATPACLLTERFWREELNCQPWRHRKVSSTFDSKSCTVVGVMPVLKAGRVLIRLPSGYHLKPTSHGIRHGTNYLFVTGMLRSRLSLAQGAGGK